MTFGLLLFACNGKSQAPVDSESVEESDDDTDAPAPPVDADADGWTQEEDCDDLDATIHPGADERCNDVDDDCDTVVDEDPIDPVTTYVDLDLDGYGSAVDDVACDVAPGAVTVGGDCDDSRADVHPGACEETVDGVDTNCDGTGDSEIPVAVTMTHAMCGKLEEFQTAETGPTALRVVAAEMADGTDLRTIHIESTKPMVLALTSREPMKWVVDEAIPGTIQEIFVFTEMGASTAEGPKGVPVTFQEVGGKSMALLAEWSSFYARDLEDELFDLTGLAVTSWAGCDEFESMTIADGKAWPPSTTEYPSRACPSTDTEPFPDPDLSILPKECQAMLTPGSPVCLTTSEYGTFLFDLAGSSCVVSSEGIDPYHYELSLGWRGQHLYGCDPVSYQLVRLGLADGRIERSYRYCAHMTDWGDQLATLDVLASFDPFTNIVKPYASWSEVTSDAEVAALPVDADPFYMIATRGDVLYTTTSHRGEIWRDSLVAPYGSFPDIALAYDDNVNGMDVTTTDVIVLKGDDEDLLLFDIEGGWIDTFALPTETAGVVCTTPE